MLYSLFCTSVYINHNSYQFKTCLLLLVKTGLIYSKADIAKLLALKGGNADQLQQMKQRCYVTCTVQLEVRWLIQMYMPWMIYSVENIMFYKHEWRLKKCCQLL